MKAPDISKESTLYVVPYAHLDTQWRWEFPQTISEYLLKTMRVNFYLADKYPRYVFNWTGANRYRLMKEYFPADYAKLKKYVEKGQWYPAGSSMEEGDVNLPNAEGILRQILYGNSYFRKEFGKASAEYMLPDCFGFPASLPSILAHAGGSVDEASVRLLETMATSGGDGIHIISSAADQMFLDIKPEMTARMPRYKGGPGTHQPFRRLANIRGIP